MTIKEVVNDLAVDIVGEWFGHHRCVDDRPFAIFQKTSLTVERRLSNKYHRSAHKYPDTKIVPIENFGSESDHLAHQTPILRKLRLFGSCDDG